MTLTGLPGTFEAREPLAHVHPCVMAVVACNLAAGIYADLIEGVNKQYNLE